MSTGTDANPPQSDPGGLQFDHAEFEQADAPEAVACAACKRPIDDSYYEINGTIFCGSCRELIERQIRGGSGFKRFLGASALGVGAAVVGALGYFLILWMSKINLSLVSIAVAFFVAKGIRRGSGGRGGLGYQLLAVFLTYLAVGAAYMATGLANEGANLPEMSGLRWVIIFAVGTVMLPVVNARESIISMVIVGFALWEAWKLTKAAPIVITGPYRIGDGPPQIATEGTPAHA